MGFSKKGQVVGYSLMLGVVVLVLAMAFAFPVKQTTDIARNNTDGDTLGMDCGNSSISNFQKGACMVTDISIFYFIGGLIVIAGSNITAKIIFA